MSAPFEGLFGDTRELRVIQFLLSLKGLEFNISELARSTGIPRQAMIAIVKKLTKWNVLRRTSRRGNANYYSIDEDSGFVEAFENLNNRIIEQMVLEAKIVETEKLEKENAVLRAAFLNSNAAMRYYRDGNRGQWTQVGEQFKEKYIEEARRALDSVLSTF